MGDKERGAGGIPWLQKQMKTHRVSEVLSGESHGAFTGHGDGQQAALGQLRAVGIQLGHVHPQHCGDCGDAVGDRDFHAVLC